VLQTYTCTQYTIIHIIHAKMNLSTVKWAQWDKTQSRELLVTAECPYTLLWAAPFPQNCPFPLRGIWNPIWYMLPWAHPSLQPKRHLDRFSLFFTDDRRVSLYLTVGCPSPPQNCRFLWGIWTWTPSNTWFRGPTEVLNLNGISISWAVFAGLTSVTDRQTDRPRYSVGKNRPHLRT